jgi:hypothetical protein
MTLERARVAVEVMMVGLAVVVVLEGLLEGVLVLMPDEVVVVIGLGDVLLVDVAEATPG